MPFIQRSRNTSMHLPAYRSVAYHLQNNRNNPRRRIGNEKHHQRTMVWENPVYPYDPRADRTNDREDHRHTRMSHATQCSRKEIHQPTQKIPHRRDRQNLQSTGNDIRLPGINLQKLIAKQIRPATERHADRHSQNHTVQKHPIHPFRLACPVILTRKAHACLRH